MYFEMPNCTVGTGDSSSLGNIMYFKRPNCTVGATDSSSILILCILKCLTVCTVGTLIAVA